MSIRTYTGMFMVCDFEGCTVQTGGACVAHDGDKGPPLAHWQPLDDGRWFCPKHPEGAAHV